MSLLGELATLFGAFRGTAIMPMKTVNITEFIQFDACIGRSRSYTGQVARFAVTTAEAASDNIHRNPVSVSLEAVLSDTPTHPLAVAQSALANLFEGGLAATKAAESLVKYYEAEEPVRLMTTRWEVPNMVITELVLAEDQQTGGSYKVTMMLEAVNIVGAALIPSELDFDANLIGAGGTLDFGDQSPVDPTEYTGPTTLGGG